MNELEGRKNERTRSVRASKRASGREREKSERGRKRMQRGRVVRELDLKSGDDRFKFHGSPEIKSSVKLVNSQLVCLLSVRFCNLVTFNLS